MRIVLDIDGVCADFVGCWARWLVERGIKPRAAVAWEFYLDYPDGTALWKQFYDDPEHLLPALECAPLIPGAFEAVASLYEHEIAFATYRPEFTLETTQRWLDNVLGIPDGTELHHVQDKATVPGDLYVDDHGPTVEALLAAGKSAYVFDQPWNREHDVPRVDGWGHLLCLVDTLAVDAPSR